MSSWIRLSVAVLAVAGVFPVTAPGQEIGFVETFALAEDRAAALEALVPGTEDYFYFHCLHLQNTEQFDQAQKLLDEWHKQHGWTPRAVNIRHRQALLTYSQNPQATLEYLRDNLGLHFSHQRELPEAERNLPSKLPANQITYDAFRSRALRANLSDGFEDRALERLAAGELNDDLRRHILQRLQRPDLPNLASLVAADLRAPNAAAFGSMAIHQAMTRAQLEALLALIPQLANDGNFVSIYLRKLLPNEDVNLFADLQAQLAYLDRLWEYAQTLAPVHNSLKAHILFRRLDVDRRRGVYDLDRFLSYLRLPRQVFYVREEFLRQVSDGRVFCDLNADYSAATRLPVIGNDEPLVADYLKHFFVEAADYSQFEELIDHNYLRRLFAETKITHGLGDKQKWAAWLSPEGYKALLDRVDLDFAWTNPRQFRESDPVELKVWVKNVDTLLVKVFEINTQNFYRSQLREIDSDVSLDGLVPHLEQVFSYNEPPHLRVERTFRLDSIDHAGVYIVDFIGNGQSSRALIRKGQLHHLVQNTQAGQLFSVFDENRQLVKDARVWISGQTYTAGELGTILVPFSTQPGPTPVILERGDFAALANFNHEAEAYQLLAGMFIDREALVRNQTAQVAIRASLRLNGTRIPLDLLKKPRLIVSATDLDGIVTTREYADLKLQEDGETVQPFHVPTRLRTVEFRLQGEVDVVSRAEPQPVAVSQSFAINEIDATDSIRDVYLVAGPTGFRLEVRGKTGEPRAKQGVSLRLKHRDFRELYQVTLQTDEAGLIELGDLREIQTFTAGVAGTPERTWQLPSDRLTLDNAIHAYVGQTIRVAYPNPQSRTPQDLSLLETRGGTFVADVSSKATWTESGLEIEGLEPGDYQLHLKPTGETVQVLVTALALPSDAGGVLVAAPYSRVLVGGTRLLEARDRAPLGIIADSADDKAIEIRLTGASPETRVHVYANHFLTPYDPWLAFQQVRPLGLGTVRWGYRESSFITGRDIGDEYRYILDRKYAPKYPGVMLARPTLILNPWATRDTESQVQIAQAGEEFLRSQTGADGAASRPGAAEAAAAAMADPATLDFLRGAAPVLLNLKPDENGVIRIDREQLAGKHFLQIVAIDPRTTAQQNLVLQPTAAEIRDLRLANGLDPDRHFAQQKQTVVLPAGQAFVLDDAGSAKFQSFDDLGDVYRLFMAISNNATLAEFQFVLDWPSKTDAEKRELYSKYACHELNFFLFKKDPAFYEKVIGPYLANKHAPEFLDTWLLSSVPERYAEPWSFHRLNAAEKILFGRTSAARREHVNRWIRESYNFQPTPRQLFDRYFETALKSAALDERSAGRELDSLAEQTQLGMRYNLGDAENARKEMANAPAPTAGAVAAMDAPRDAAGAGGFGGGLERGAVAEEALAKGAPPASRARAGKKLEAADEFKADDKQRADQVLSLELRQREVEQAKELGESRQKIAELLFYRRIPKTQEWVENNYYRLPLDQQTPELVPINRFWRDYAALGDGEQFLSPYFPEAARSFSEMMLALAVLDLPLAAQEHPFEIVENQLRTTPPTAAIAFYQQVNPAAFDERGANVLVSENFFRADDRYRQEGPQRFDKFVVDEFLTHVLYGSQVVLTNPTSTPHAIDLLVQIPQGALPAVSTQITRTIQIDLQPFSTQTFEYWFYFPHSGQFAHYPAHVTLENRVIAAAQKLPFNVVDQATRIDRSSWAYISQHGSDEEVIAFLSQENLNGHDLSKIAFRMRDKEFFQRVTALLDERLAYDHVLWSYAIHHDDRGRAAQFLAHCEDFLRASGPALISPLVTIDPVVRRWYQHREYWPLANARAHRLGRTRQITNPVIHQQYHEWLGVLACRREFSPEDRLQLAYFLLLQDRFAEGITQFERLERNSLPEALQYDYLSSYVSLLKEELDTAEQIARRRIDFPVDRWSKLFQTVLAHVTEARGGKPDPSDPANREERQAELAAKQPGFEFDVEARQIQLTYQNLSAVTINYYTMDVELLFSSNPFVHQQTDGFSIIRPNTSQTVELPGDQKKLTLDLPEEYRHANVLVEITAAGQRKSKPYFAHSLVLSVNENYGQLRVLHQGDQRPLSKVYVKVYAQKADGSTAFYKDGYTDVRGRFDYVSLSNQSLDDIQRFSMLVSSDEFGAIIQEAGIPKE